MKLWEKIVVISHIVGTIIAIIITATTRGVS